MIEAGKKVQFDYVLTIDGQQVDTSAGRKPLEYVHGEGKIVRGLEQQLEGLKVGAKQTITVSAEEGYGQVNPDAFKEIPKTSLPENIEPKVGMILQLNHPQRGKVAVVIAEVRDTTIVINFNHPLAGKELQFDVTIVNIQ
ncbi:MAG: FKBP-type peptidyl-prolyl cis-trans isomerase [Candidatus Omnitrophica bacterium]|nr:FKBP-type peptidyl-prolyl cis-trans isomerase [Candidatus Omnitrophota bacterium]